MTERLLTGAELAQLLNVSPHWVRRHTHKRSDSIPHFRLGRYPRYRIGDVLEWLESQRHGGGRRAA